MPSPVVLTRLAEPRLVPPVPRKVGRVAKKAMTSAGTWSMTVLAGLVFMLFTGAMVLPFLSGMAADLVLDVAGTTVPGSITGVGESRSSNDGVHPLFVHFAFRVDGHDCTGQSYADAGSELASASVGSPTQVVVVRAHPTWARLLHGRSNAFGRSVLVTLFFPCFGFAIMLPGLVVTRRRRRIYRYGLATVGRVRRIEPVRNATINGRTPDRFCWSYATPDGQTREGSYLIDHSSPLQMYEPGEPIVVLYLPSRPDKGMPYLD